MEVSAVEGTFRSTCERVMGVLRSHQDSLMAMLEAFIHDPLIKWRLLQPEAGNADAVGGGRSRALPIMMAENVTIPAHVPTTLRGERGSGDERPTTELSVSGSRRNSLDPSLRTSLEESFGFHSQSMDARSGLAESFQRPTMERSPTLEGSYEPEALNERAVRVIGSIQNKLSGREFGDELPVSQQVQRLIEAATSHQNLSSLFVGWCAFW